MELLRQKLAIIGIDSLDPSLLHKFRSQLPIISQLINESSTLVSKTIFTADSIPAWTSIFTGLRPERHGVFYSYDIFDPNLSDLSQIDVSHLRGKTFWDYANRQGLQSAIVFPLMIYPSYHINGVMISKSPFEKRIDEFRTLSEISVHPDEIKHKYDLPDQLDGVWGGFPGIKHCPQWLSIAKQTHNHLKKIGLKIFKNEPWDIFFIYFHILDIIQHRLWRFSDKTDPTYPGQTPLQDVILEYYKLFDTTLSHFFNIHPHLPYLVISDHGHKLRPVHTININDILQKKGYLKLKKKENRKLLQTLRKAILEVAYRLNIEHWLMRLVISNQHLTKLSKSLYSSMKFINIDESVAYLSNFIGIKSYSHGGIEVNRELISDKEYQLLVDELIQSLSRLKTDEHKPVFHWIQRRDHVFQGPYTEKIYPAILFELNNNYGVGWDINSGVYGTSYDHKVASGGHSSNSTILMKNIDHPCTKNSISIVDVAPTILDLLNLDFNKQVFDGSSFLS